MQTESVFNCLKATIRWSDLRWDAGAILYGMNVSSNGVFVLTRSDIELLKKQIPNLDNTVVRGYLGVVVKNDVELQLQLMLVSQDRDIGISLNPPAFFEELLVVGSYSTKRSEEKINEIVEAIRQEGGTREEMADRIDRWRRTYDVYIPTMTNHEKTGNTGLVRLFEIPGRDLSNEIEGGCNRVLCFFALYQDASIELIFQGIVSGDERDEDKVVLIQRSAEATNADDFTTPHPPFDSDQGYGLMA